MATTNMVYTNPQKQSASKVDNSNRFKVNEKMLALMAKNPTLGIGYVIGSMLGENYFGKKRAKSTTNAVGKGEIAGNGGTEQTATGAVDWDKMNQILNAYTGGNNAMNTPSVANATNQQQGWVASPGQGVSVSAAPAPVAAPAVPQTPQQANAPAVTLNNAGAMGGVPTAQDQWAQMQNGNNENAGITAMFTNGVRNLDNVLPAGSGQGIYDIALEEVLKDPLTKQYFVK